MVQFIKNGHPGCARVLFMHGAGAPMDSEFMTTFALALASDDIEVVRFEFPYMAQRRLTQKKTPPPKAEKVVESCLDVLAQFNDVPLFLLGKSMGGRIGSMVLDQSSAKAGFALGYPFHPIGKPSQLRTEHLKVLKKPLFVFQGTRDPMGCKEEVEGYELSDAVDVIWLADANHDLKPRAASGYTQSEYIELVSKRVVDEINRVLLD